MRVRVRVRVRGGDSRPVNQTQNVSTRAVTVHVGCDASFSVGSVIELNDWPGPKPFHTV
jgi:hypothetical protein